MSLFKRKQPTETIVKKVNKTKRLKRYIQLISYLED